MQFYKFKQKISETNKTEFIADNIDDLMKYLYNNYKNLEYKRVINRFYNMTLKFLDIEKVQHYWIIQIRYKDTKEEYKLIDIDCPCFTGELTENERLGVGRILALVRNHKLENLLEHLDI